MRRVHSLFLGSALSCICFGGHLSVAASLIHNVASSPLSNSEGSKTKHVYFGFGAMCNPISRERRNVPCTNPRPAILPNFRLDFALMGMGNVVETNNPDACVHGVVMEYDTDELWERVKDIENAYEVKRVKVFPYKGDPVEAYVFFVKQNDGKSEGRTKEISLPQERYLKVIAYGMRHHGVDEDFIKTQVLAVDCIPSRKPDEYLSFPSDPEPLPTISYSEYQERAKTNPCFLINDRVVDIVGDLQEEDHPFLKVLNTMYVGQECITEKTANIIYDPDLPDTEQWRWAENQFIDFAKSSGLEEKLRVTRRIFSIE